GIEPGIGGARRHAPVGRSPGRGLPRLDGAVGRIDHEGPSAGRVESEAYPGPGETSDLSAAARIPDAPAALSPEHDRIAFALRSLESRGPEPRRVLERRAPRGGPE